MRRLPGVLVLGFRIERCAPRRPRLALDDVRVAEWVGAGRANKEIAADLGTSSTSAARAVSRVCRALGLRRRLDLALLWAALARANAGMGATPISRSRREADGASVLRVDLGETSAWAKLAPRERTVVALAVSGWPARRIAAHGRMRSSRTIENQLAGAFRKLGISGRAQLVARLFRV